MPNDGGVRIGRQLCPQCTVLVRTDRWWSSGGDIGSERATQALAASPAADRGFTHLKGCGYIGMGYARFGSRNDTCSEISAVSSHPPRLSPRSTYQPDALACTTGALLLILLGNWHVHVPSGDAAGTMFVLLVFLGFATVGALASARHPENASGWIFLAAGVMYSVVSVARVYAIDALFAAPDTLPGGDLSAWIAAWLTLPPVFLISTFMPLVFPTGHLPSARWRPFA